ncbi:MAG: DUF465 domain-containing protein [Pseudomonadota bacterium]
MSHVPHELAEEFPDQIDALRQLRQTDARVARLTDEYHTINRTLHRVETNVQPMCDVEALRLRKTRIALKDEIARILKQFEPA